MIQAAKDAFVSKQDASEEEVQRQAKALSRLKAELQRKEALLKAVQSQLDEVRIVRACQLIREGQ